jgi:hypothetical protein
VAAHSIEFITADFAEAMHVRQHVDGLQKKGEGVGERAVEVEEDEFVVHGMPAAMDRAASASQHM